MLTITSTHAKVTAITVYDNRVLLGLGVLDEDEELRLLPWITVWKKEFTPSGGRVKNPLYKHCKELKEGNWVEQPQFRYWYNKKADRHNYNLIGIGRTLKKRPKSTRRQEDRSDRPKAHKDLAAEEAK